MDKDKLSDVTKGDDVNGAKNEELTPEAVISGNGDKNCESSGVVKQGEVDLDCTASAVEGSATDKATVTEDAITSLTETEADKKARIRKRANEILAENALKRKRRRRGIFAVLGALVIVCVLLLGLYIKISTPNMNEDGIYEISSVWHFDFVRRNLNKDYILVNDIDFKNRRHKVIGSYNGNVYNVYFSGKFDGDGYTLRNVRIKVDEEDKYSATYMVGFFGYCYKASIVDLKIDGLAIDCEILGTETENYVGGLVGMLGDSCIVSGCRLSNVKINLACEGKLYVGVCSGFINNAVVQKTNVQGGIDLTLCRRSAGVGGIAGGNGSSGRVYVTKSDCVLNTDIIGRAAVGGLVGDNSGSIGLSDAVVQINTKATVKDAICGGSVGKNVYSGKLEFLTAEGSVKALSEGNNTYCGGLVGMTSGTIENSSSKCEVSAHSVVDDCYAGGFVGYASGLSSHLYACWSSGNVVAGAQKGNIVTAGGYAGYASLPLIVGCYSSSKVTIEEGSVRCGGFVGTTQSDVSCCYSLGDCSIESEYDVSFGGFAGYLWSGSIVESYSICKADVISTNKNLVFGGFIGYVWYNAAKLEVQNCLSYMKGTIDNPISLNKKRGIFVGFDDDYENIVASDITNSYTTEDSGFTVNGEAMSYRDKDRVLYATNEMVSNGSFYTALAGWGLAWDADNWSLKDINFDEGVYPKLKLGVLVTDPDDGDDIGTKD
ncbi:MAG: hypothetical protein PHX51_08105 [Clostridia bacterium]|nr:hypothetical protein [Clostridia bacterium]